MKPLRIELQAFGSYPGKEVVDFTLLTQRGLFVITGETGTGKTTIFDAMCYALYGAMPSKEGNDIRSHHAASTTPTYVVFQFEVDGVTYSARREPAQERAAKRGGGIITEAAKAQLDRLDTKASLATRAGDVTQRCTELVGLKADQFQKVILLPQGEVAKFLVAGSKEREELLGQLFGGQVFDAIVDELRARERDLGTKVTKVNSDIDYALTTARQQVRRVHEVLELDTATDDNIDDTADDTAIRAALAAVQPVLDDVILRAAAATEQVQAATAAFEDAKAQAARFERAATLRATLDDLSERKPQVEADEQRGIRSRDARPLVAADDAFAGAARVQAAADAELAQRRDAITQAFAPLGMVPDITSATAVTAAVHQLQVDLQRQRGLLDAHHAAQQALAEAQQSHDALVAQLVDAQLELSGHHSAVQQLETLLPAALTLAADAPRLAEALTAVGTALTRRAQLDEAMEQWRAASATATQASSAFDDLLRRFDTTAAPRLAAALQPGQPCPVCGSAEHPQPSTATSDHTSDHTSDGLVSFDGIVSFDGLEHAAGARNATAQARQVVEAEVAGLRGALGADADTPTAELHTRQLELQQQHEAATAAQRRADDLTDALAAAHQAAEVAQLAQARLEVSITSALDTITSCTNAVATATAAAEGVDARGLDTQQVVLQAVEPLCDDLDGCFDRSITTAAAAAALAQQRDDTLASSPFQVIDDARAQLLDAAHESSVLEAATAWRDQVTTANGQLSELDQQGIPARAPDVEAADANATAVA
ncbi:MAG: SMC family ATPase [Actinomycetota bacterium]